MVLDNLLFLHSLLFGFFIGFLYDPLIVGRIVRKKSPNRECQEDLLFFLFCTFLCFLFLYRENKGELRWFIVAGVVLGIYFYRKSVGIIFVKIRVWIWKKLERIFRIPKKILGIPVYSFKRWLKNTKEMIIIRMKRVFQREECREDGKEV